MTLSPPFSRPEHPKDVKDEVIAGSSCQGRIDPSSPIERLTLAFYSPIPKYAEKYENMW